jgi:hypothetical protein
MHWTLGPVNAVLFAGRPLPPKLLYESNQRTRLSQLPAKESPLWQVESSCQLSN